ncbi:hypothetical protein L1887_57088 [Cichorium endivia]|nr:hypothetical protein L1887_57088 [Cichorium endivia]
MHATRTLDLHGRNLEPLSTDASSHQPNATERRRRNEDNTIMLHFLCKKRALCLVGGVAVGDWPIVGVRARLGHGGLVKTSALRAREGGRGVGRAVVGGLVHGRRGLDAVATVVLLRSLAWVVGVVFPHAVDRIRRGGAVVHTLLLGQLLVLHHSAVGVEALLGAPVGGPEVHKIREEEDVEEEGDCPLANGSGRDDAVAPVVARVGIAPADTVADDESDRARDGKRQDDRLDDCNNLERSQAVVVVREREHLEHLEQHRERHEHDKDERHAPVDCAVVERIEDAEQHQSRRTNDGADDRADIQDRLLLANRAGNATQVSQVTLRKGRQDVEGGSKCTEDDEERLVRRTHVRDKDNRRFFHLVLGEAIARP